MAGEAEPDTGRCVDIATQAALKKMILPGVIAVFTSVDWLWSRTSCAWWYVRRGIAGLCATRADDGECRWCLG